MNNFKYSKGEWVQVNHKESPFNGLPGYILTYGIYLGERCYKVVIMTKTGKAVRSAKERHLISIEDLDDLKQSDIYDLIDIALDLKDKEWFDELTSKLLVESW